jgi:glycosyltransferase involved in cell wall biosynthesis
VTTREVALVPDVPESRDHVLEVVVPVYNEEEHLDSSIRRLRSYLDHGFPIPSLVTIADNASTDGTFAVAKGLADALPGVRVVHLDRKGRGHALRSVWSGSSAEVVSYMDVDLSTDLDALFPLIAPLVSGHSDLAVGSRLARGARVIRGAKRDVISRCYNLLLRVVLGNRISDAQCGFKAVRMDVAKSLLPLIEDQGWFFDTELLILAGRNGLRIHEVPVDWTDDPDSRVDLKRTAIDDLKGVWRMFRHLARGRGLVEALPARQPRQDPEELIRFAGVGVASTLAYLVLFALFRGLLGALTANVVALGLCTGANLAANGRFTFAARRPVGHRAVAVGGLTLLATSVAATTAALVVVHELGFSSLASEAIGLVVANCVAAGVRLAILRSWIFRSSVHRDSNQPSVARGAAA